MRRPLGPGHLLGNAAGASNRTRWVPGVGGEGAPAPHPETRAQERERPGSLRHARTSQRGFVLEQPPRTAENSSAERGTAPSAPRPPDPALRRPHADGDGALPATSSCSTTGLRPSDPRGRHRSPHPPLPCVPPQPPTKPPFSSPLPPQIHGTHARGVGEESFLFPAQN